MKFGQWLGFVCLIISLYILWQIRHLMLLIFTAIVLTVALNRIVRRFQQLGIRRSLAIILTLILSCGVAFIFFVLIVPPFIAQFQKLLELLPNVWDRVRSDLIRLREQTLQLDWLPTLPSLSDLIQELQPLGTIVFTNFFAFFSNSLTIILQLLLVVVLAIMLLFNPQGYRQAFLQLFPSFYRRRANEVLTLSETALGNWLVGIVIDSTFVALLSGIGLFILGVKLVLVHALLAGLLNFIPNIGPTASVVFPIMIALLDSPWKIVAILILYFIIQNIESYLLAPTIMAQQVSLLPAVTLMAQIFFAQMFGLLGLLLALPLTVVAKTWLDEVLLKDVLDKWELKPIQAYQASYLPSKDITEYSEDYAEEEKLNYYRLAYVFLVILALFGEAKSETVIETIQRTGLLRVGVREDAVPFGYRDLNNNLSGLCLDFIYVLRKKIREELNQNIITIKLYKSTLFNRFDMVENRVVDLECSPNSIQKNIARNVEFSKYFFITGTQFLIRQEDKNKFGFNANLSNLTLGVLSETTTQKFIQEKYPLAQLQEFQGVTGRLRGVQAVQSGKIDAFVSDGILLLGEATLMGLSLEDYQIVPQKPLNCEYYGLLLPKNDPQWRDFVNSTIEQAQTLDILQDWFTVVAPYVVETFQFCQQTLPQTD